jgi:hypothetical protein
MLRAGSRLAARANLPAIRQVTAQQVGIFVRNFPDLIQAEVTEFAAAWPESPAAGVTAPAMPTIFQFFQIVFVIAHRLAISSKQRCPR